MTNIIQVDNLTKNFKIRTNHNVVTGIFKPKYEYVYAVKNVSFEVREGESLAFLGPNGAGKTTTTKMLTGLIYPTSGHIKVLGYTPFDRKKEYLRQIGLVMGNKTGLSWDLTGNQSFRFIQSIYHISESKYQKTLDELTTMLDVKKHLNKQLRKLSLGERMKMELIGAIIHSPKVLFLDEPTIGLDIIAKKNIRNFLREIQRNSNITIVLTSHDMDDVEKVCDRVIVINKGEKVFDNDISKLMRDYTTEKFIKVYFDTMPKSHEMFKDAKIEKVEEDSITFKVNKDLAPKLISTAIENFTVLDIDIVTMPLEEMIEDIYKQSSKKLEVNSIL